MQVQVLGHVRVTDRGASVSIGGPRQRAVLAVLVAAGRDGVSVDRLIDEIWGEKPPRAARNSVQSMISNLRKVLSADPRITIDSEGRRYRLRAPVEAVDSYEFTARVDEARRGLGGQLESAIECFRDGLELWHGPAYGDVADEVDLLRVDAARLEELRLTALECLIEAEIDSGQAASVVGELEALIADHPLREGLYRLLMLALYRADRQAEALRVVSRLRQVLAGELGIEPSAAVAALEQQIIDQSVDSAPPEMAAIVNPYRGLAPFIEADASLFYGRERLTGQLVDRLAAYVDGHRFLAVVGASGSGKSSVVRAGLIPAVRRGAVPGSERWVVVQIVPGIHPLRDLEAALLRIAVNPPPTLLEQLTRDELGLSDAVRRILPDDGSEVLLVVDQFEELFTIADPTESGQFIDALVGAVNAPESRLRAVITLRADFYDRPLGHPTLAPLLAKRHETVVAMTPDELSEAIVGPAEGVGVAVESGLVAAVVADATGQPGALPLVQYALTDLFEHRAGDTMTLDSYRELGGVRGAIGQRAEALYGSLDEVGKRAVRAVLLELVTLGEGEEDTRRRVARDDFTAKRADDVLGLFGEARLLSFDQDGATGGATVEVAHEALLREWPRLRAWIDEGRDDIRTHRRLQNAAREWTGADRAPGYLLTGQRLTTFEQWAQGTEQALSPDETDFLESSSAAAAAERQKRARTRRRVLTTLAAASILSITLAGVALLRSRQAAEQTRIAEVRELAASAIAALTTDPELSTILALEAVEREPIPVAQEALHKAIAAQRVVLSLPAAGGAAVYLEDSTVAALNEDGTITTYDISSGEPEETSTIGTPGWLETIRLGTRSSQMISVADGAMLAVGTADGFLVMIDRESGSEMWREKIGEYSPQTAATVDGDYIAARAWIRPELSDGEVGGGVYEGATGNQIYWAPTCCMPGIAMTRKPGRDARVIHEHWMQEHTFVVDFFAVDSLALDSLSEGDDGLSRPERVEKLWEKAGIDESKSAPITGELLDAGKRYYLALPTSIRGQVSVYSIDSGEAITAFSGHQSEIWSLDLDAIETVAASGGGDGTARVWSMRDGTEKYALPVGQGGVLSVEFNSDSSRLLTVGAQGKAQIWDVSPIGGAEVPGVELSGYPLSPAFFRSVNENPLYVSFLDGGTRLMVRSSNSETTLILDLATGQQTELRHGIADSTAVSPNGGILAIAKGGLLTVFDGAAYDSSSTYGSTRPDTTSPLIAFSPSGTTLAMWTTDGRVDVYDTTTWELLDSPLAVDVTSLNFDDTDRLVTTHRDGFVRRWAIGTLAPHRPVGSRIGTSVTHGNVMILADMQGGWHAFDLDTEATAHAPRFAHAGGISAMVVSRAAPLMATAGSDGVIKLWDLEDGTQLMALTEIGPPVQSLAFSSDGRYLAAIDEDAIRVYTLDVDRLAEIARSRITRQLTEAECRQYLHSEGC